LVVALVILASAPGWSAEAGAPLDDQAAAVNRTAHTPEGERVVADRLSRDLGLSATTLEAQRQQTKLGWGELLIANRLAQTTGMTFDQVVSEFRSGKGWGQIAGEHKVNLGKLVSEVRESRQAAENDARQAGRGRRAADSDTDSGDRGSRPEHMGPERQGMGGSMGPGTGGGMGPGMGGRRRGR
jgi:hypothetical protein